MQLTPSAFFAMLALAACDKVAGQVLGPSERSIREALAKFYAQSEEMPGWPTVLPDQEAFRKAKIMRAGSCEPLGASFFCDAEYELASGERVTVSIDMVKYPQELGGWKTLSGPMIVDPSPK